MSARAARIVLIAVLSLACTTEGDYHEEAAPMLEMKPACLRCETPTPPDADAFICSFECTFCARCAQEMERVCPNCGGELRPRPKRR